MAWHADIKVGGSVVCKSHNSNFNMFLVFPPFHLKIYCMLSLESLKPCRLSICQNMVYNTLKILFSAFYKVLISDHNKSQFSFSLIIKCIVSIWQGISFKKNIFLIYHLSVKLFGTSVICPNILSVSICIQTIC